MKSASPATSHIFPLLALLPALAPAADTPAPATITSDPAQSPTATESTLHRWFNDPPQIHVGPVDIHPRVMAGLTFDDNILIQSENPKSDLIYSLQPAVMLLAGDRGAMALQRLNGGNALGIAPLSYLSVPAESWPGAMFALDYGPRFKWFQRYSENDSIDQLPVFNAVIPFSRTMLGLYQSYTFENTTVIEAGQRTEQETYSTAITSGWHLSDKSSLEINLRRRSYDYASQNLNGYTDWSTDDWFHYQTTARINLALGVTAGYVDVASGDHQTYQQILGRVIYLFAEKMNLDASFGAEIRQFSSGIDNTLEPVFSVTANYTPWPATRFWLNAHRQDYASVTSGQNYIQTGCYLGVSQKFWDRYTVNLSGGYDNSSYLAIKKNASTDRDDNYFSTRLSFDARFNPCLRGSLFYLFNQNQSNAYDGYTDNQVGLQVTYGW